MYAAAIDALHRTSHRRHGMAVGDIRTMIQYPKTINDNSWYINANSCKTNNQRQFVVIEFSPSPLRVCGKVVILQRETQIGFCMD